MYLGVKAVIAKSIARIHKGNLVNHVLGKFSKGERVLAEQGIKDAASAVEVMILEDINTAMNKFN